MKCPNCGVPLMPSMVVCPKCKYDTRCKDGGKLFKMKEELSDEEWTVAKDELKEREQQLMREMLMTTCPSMEGYRIVSQRGLVFGETISNQPVSVDMNKGKGQYSGELLSVIRERALEQMKEEASMLEANGIVGIKTAYAAMKQAGVVVESNYLLYTIYGTAVVLEKIEE